MQMDKELFSHNRIISWYDSGMACWTIIIMSTTVLLFALCGMRVASTTPDYEPFLWFPVTLAGMSLFLIIKSSLRIIRQGRQY